MAMYWPPLLAAILDVAALPLAAQPALSPSIEADADYLLTTTDFMDAQFGMAIEAVEERQGTLAISTTGAEMVFEPSAGVLHLRQRLGKRREAAVVSFGESALEGLTVERKGTGAVLLSARGGELQMRVNGDSLLMLRDAEPLAFPIRWASIPCRCAPTPATAYSWMSTGAWAVTSPLASPSSDHPSSSMQIELSDTRLPQARSSGSAWRRRSLTIGTHP